MFIILQGPTILDSVVLHNEGSLCQLQKIRTKIKQLSQTNHLIAQIQKGVKIMDMSSDFNKYLKSQVDLMKKYVTNGVPCNFKYAPSLSMQPFDATNLPVKEQWAVQIVMSRYNLCWIYNLSSFFSIHKLCQEIANSYKPNYKGMSEIIKHLQNCFLSFKEGYEPLQRLSTVYDSLNQLISPSSRKKQPELSPEVFSIYCDVMQCNLAIIKLEKYRILREYKSCSEGFFLLHQRMVDFSLRIQKHLGIYHCNEDLLVGIKLGKIFFRILTLYFLLQHSEESKLKEDFGFVKKEFQQMIVDNLAMIKEIEKLKHSLDTFPKRQSLQSVIIAITITNVIIEEIKKYAIFLNRMQYKYNINIHENKIEMPKIQDVLQRKIGHFNLWEKLEKF